MRVPRSLRVIGFGLAALLVAAAPAHATDYFALDLRHAEFAPELLGPPTQFAPSAPAFPVATVREAAPTAQAVAATSRRVHVTRVREAARRPHRNPLNALASYTHPRNRPCTGASICVFDGVHGRWRAR
jgi:hypothetical protein